MKESFDILIVGAGASGLAAAISAKRTLPRLRVAMLERLPRVGKKILATGNGRCNLTNLNARSHGYTNREFADSVFEKYDEQRVLQFFKSIGLFDLQRQLRQSLSDEQHRVRRARLPAL